MIAFLTGEVAALVAPSTVYLDVNGVGYGLAMPGGDLSRLSVGESVRVLTYLAVSENGIALYGFLSEDEKVMFEKLIAVSGVGPKVALAALSTFAPRELADAIAARRGATEALLSMGFTSAEAEVALKGAPEGADEGALLQYALKRLGSR